MRSFLGLLQSLGSAGARQNAWAELELAERRRIQAAKVVHRIGTIDGLAVGRDRAASGPRAAAPAAA